MCYSFGHFLEIGKQIQYKYKNGNLPQYMQPENAQYIINKMLMVCMHICRGKQT